VLTRRQFIAGGVAIAAAGVAACSSGGSSTARGGSGAARDFSAGFARFPLADEPNGDLSKVVWPDFVTNAGPEVKRLYEFQITHGEVSQYVPCFADAGRTPGTATTVTVTSSK
jgi:hypothetical protein